MSTFEGTKSNSKYMPKTKIIVTFFQGHSFSVLKRCIDQADHRKKSMFIISQQTQSQMFIFMQ
jgi:hypothetical protein